MSSLTTEQQKKFSRCFPRLLHFVLCEVEKLGLDHIISWQPTGRSFCIHDQDLFLLHIVPQFFAKQTKLRSFFRQLNLWGFQRCGSKSGDNVWTRENFSRGEPENLKSIRRCEQSTGGSVNGSSSSSSMAGSARKGKKKKTQKSSKHGVGHSAAKGRGANRIQSRKNAVVKVETSEKSNYSSSSSLKHLVGTTTVATTSTVHEQVKSFRPSPLENTPYPTFSSNNFSRSTNVSDDEQDSDYEQRGRGMSPSYYHYPCSTSSSHAAHFDCFGCYVAANGISAVQEFLPENPVSNNMAVVDGTHDMEELSFLEGVTDINEFMERQPSTLVLDDDGSVSLDDEIDFDTIFEVGVGVGVEC
mmetsp:Transcript_22693/g.47417  ORF Transcript_22693/g.47417 Transcript_22693/m.47417 type:complete len:357 (-) Transcript_22693:79-1149(-)|eukprot:CAMPEP_0171343520 /NCGR_PEP_ID=MMETSP0878-20121228/17361_1 /TAXON_ID=67004 /ORGANISM="Thalassiosira weissflogii, Strain CCMP1336" /LENGTH=356 /DNA_ID=CAMNT_0011846483 /DNA_START=99 /DNA_END=1169 /DNA_ORIENTATION=+